MSEFININGEILGRSSAKVSIFDRGFLFGDSIYEVLRTYEKKYLFHFEDHMVRLHESAKRLYLEHPFSDEIILNRISQTVSKTDHANSYIRIIITRGESDITLDFSNVQNPKLIIIVKPHANFPKEYYASGIHLKTVSIRRNPICSLDPAIKSGNYVNNMLAYYEAKSGGAEDAILLNPDGFVTESSTSNIFFIMNGVLHTPAYSVGILHGVTRHFVIELANQLNIPVEEGAYTSEQLHHADEIFLSSTLKEILPVTRLDDLSVANGKVGPITQQLSSTFTKKVAAMLDHHQLKRIVE